MTRFVITIAADGDPAAAQTTVRVDTSTGEVRIAELTVRGGGAGLTPSDLPVIDFDLLLRAIALDEGAAGPGHRVLTADPSGSADAAAGTRRARKAAGSSAPRRARTTRRRTAPGEPEQPARQYRRMPDAAEVVQAYQQVGTIKGLAEHFGVPRHTINGWARRLRSQGYQIGRG